MSRKTLSLALVAAISFSAIIVLRARPAADDAAEITNSIGMKLKLIQPGKFTMGSPASEKDRRFDETPHIVTLTRPFYLSAYEVTQEEYERMSGANPSYFSPTGEGRDEVSGQNTARFPVENVSWFDAIDFCNALSRKENLPEYYRVNVEDVSQAEGGGKGYRLPTEAEWEYACRAGTMTIWSSGNDAEKLADFANIADASLDAALNSSTPTAIAVSDGHVFTSPVGNYRANAFGLFDMNGNVFEWCQDWYGETYYAESPRDNPGGPSSGDYRILRGGAWIARPEIARSANRYRLAPVSRHYDSGFRVSRTP